MASDVKDYVGRCAVCQGNRVPRHKPYGQLESLPLPTRPWDKISIDFITDLAPSAGLNDRIYDTILVVVNRYTKMALFLPTTKDLNAAQLAKLLNK